MSDDGYRAWSTAALLPAVLLIVNLEVALIASLVWFFAGLIAAYRMPKQPRPPKFWPLYPDEDSSTNRQINK
jgi:hypothetical protein